MISDEVIERARNVPIEDELVRRGIKLRGRNARCGPCPVCGGRDRFAVNIRKQAWNCRGCSKGGDVIALVQHVDSVSFAAAVEVLSGESMERAQAPQYGPPPAQDAANYEAHQRRKACWLWSKCQPVAGSPAERYLREARGYRGPLPATIGYLSARGGHPPAMIAAYGLADEPEPGMLAIADKAVQAVHLTKLAPDGRGKAGTEKDKITVASPLGSPIVLAPPNDLLGLAVCEGIEDALSAHEATGLGAWAAGAAGFMPALADAVPTYIECVTIYAHADRAGQDGARRLAQALTERSVEVFIEGLG